MIQRIQSLFLAIAVAIFAVISFVNPIWTSATEQLLAQDDTKMFVLCLSAMLLSLLAIFMFKNRKLQMKFVRLAVITEMVMAVRMYLVQMEHEVVIEVNTYLLMAAALIALVLAYRGIKKDEDLVRSVDRIR